jgi:hypothetical protein
VSGKTNGAAVFLGRNRDAAEEQLDDSTVLRASLEMRFSADPAAQRAEHARMERFFAEARARRAALPPEEAPRTPQLADVMDRLPPPQLSPAENAIRSSSNKLSVMQKFMERGDLPEEQRAKLESWIVDEADHRQRLVDEYVRTKLASVPAHAPKEPLARCYVRLPRPRASRRARRVAAQKARTSAGDGDDPSRSISASRRSALTTWGTP